MLKTSFTPFCLKDIYHNIIISPLNTAFFIKITATLYFNSNKCVKQKRNFVEVISQIVSYKRYLIMNEDRKTAEIILKYLSQQLFGAFSIYFTDGLLAVPSIKN